MPPRSHRHISTLPYVLRSAFGLGDIASEFFARTCIGAHPRNVPPASHTRTPGSAISHLIDADPGLHECSWRSNHEPTCMNIPPEISARDFIKCHFRATDLQGVHVVSDLGLISAIRMPPL